MKVCGSVLLFAAILVDVSGQFGRFPGVSVTISTPTFPGADGKWPFEIYLLDGKITLNPEYGNGSSSVRRDKSDNIRKMSGYINVKKEITCTTQGYYVIDKFVVDPTVFPPQLPPGEYILDLIFTMFHRTILSLHFKGVIENH
ncbi:uncharacterized protein [Anabrus simplex]|uniref:uncharacterized protein n=1 Tax=Anabrus simplex TaxID=316456 RepID=UPI0035A2686F